MASLSRKPSEFEIRRESPKDANQIANLYDAEGLYDYYGLKPWTDITDRVAQKITSAIPSLSTKKASFLDDLTNNAQRITVETPFVRWKLAGTNRISFRIQENVAAALTAPGVGLSEFPIKLNTDVFVPGDKVAPELDRSCELVIQSYGAGDGDGWVYQVQGNWDNPDSYFPPVYLEEGTRFVKAGPSIYGEGSSDWGSSLIDTGMSFVEFQVPLAKTGKSVTITDEALRTVIRISPKDDKGMLMQDVPSKITTIAELQFNAEVRWEKEYALMWSRASTSVLDHSSEHYRRSNASIRQFLESSNIFYYPIEGGSIRMITDFLDTVWFDRVMPDNARVVVWGGKEFGKVFDRWIRAEFGDAAVVRRVEDFVRPNGDIIPGGNQAYELRNPMFNKYHIPVYGTIEYRHLPILDSTWLGGPNHPKTGKPLTSYEGLILDYGLGQGAESNVVLVNRSNAETFYYETGAVSPSGPINERNGRGRYQGVHGGRSLTLRHGDEFGLLIKDPLKICYIRPNVQ